MKAALELCPWLSTPAKIPSSATSKPTSVHATTTSTSASSARATTSAASSHKRPVAAVAHPAQPVVKKRRTQTMPLSSLIKALSKADPENVVKGFGTPGTPERAFLLKLTEAFGPTLSEAERNESKFLQEVRRQERKAVEAERPKHADVPVPQELVLEAQKRRTPGRRIHQDDVSRQLLADGFFKPGDRVRHPHWNWTGTVAACKLVWVTVDWDSAFAGYRLGKRSSWRAKFLVKIVEPQGGEAKGEAKAASSPSSPSAQGAARSSSTTSAPAAIGDEESEESGHDDSGGDDEEEDENLE